MSRSTINMQAVAADSLVAGAPTVASARRSAAETPGDRDATFPDGDDVTNNSHAFEALRLSSTATLVEISQNVALREELADPSAIQILFDTWRSATHPQIRRNCALAISNLYSTLEMFHDDLMLPVLGLCTPESSIAELSACSRALSRRALLSRPIDVIFIPSLLTAVMSIIRRDGATPLMRAECVLVLLQLLDNAQDNPEGNPESLIEAVNTLVTGGLSQVATGAKSPRKEASPTGKGSESPRKMAATKVLSRGSSFRNAMITPQASLAAAHAAKALSSRPSFRLTASLTAGGAEGSSTGKEIAKQTLATNVEAEEIDDDTSSQLSLPTAPVSVQLHKDDVATGEPAAHPEPFGAVRIAMEYGLLGLVVSIAKVCQDSLGASGLSSGAETTARPRGAAACVPPSPPPPDALQPPADMVATDVDAVYLTDAIEYSVACLLRISLVPAFLADLSSRQVVGAMVSLMSMRRMTIRDGAARILFLLVGHNDSALVQEISNNQEMVQALSWVALKQAQEMACVPPSTLPVEPGPDSLPLTASSSLCRLAARALLALSCIPNVVFALVSAKAGDALLLLYHVEDHLTRRWALLALCNLFELSEHGREDLLKLGFLPIMVDTVNIAVAEAESGRFKEFKPVARGSGITSKGKVATDETIDRFAYLDAATSCAIAICALTAGNREVVLQLLSNGTLRMLSRLVVAARIFLREGITGLGAVNSLPKRQRRLSAAPAQESDAGAPAPQLDDAYMGMPHIWYPKVLLASVNALSNLAMLPECTMDILSAGDTPIVDSLVGCVPARPYLTHGTGIIPRHISDTVLAEWAAAEKGIQLQAVSSLCSLCSFPYGQQAFASRADQVPSALEVLCRIAGAIPLNATATFVAAPASADQSKATPTPVVKAPLVRQPSIRLGRSASATNEELVQDVGKMEIREKEKGRDRPKPFVWDTLTKERAAYYLCVLSAISTCHAPLIRLGCIPLFISNIRHVHSRMRQECAQAIYNVTCTAVRDVPPSEGRELISGYGISRVKLLIDADIAAALTIGSLFRADDDATRDLCAAAMHNVLSTTFLLQQKQEMTQQRDTDVSQEIIRQEDSPGLLSIQQLRSRLLRDGLLWAVIKLTQGLHNKEEEQPAALAVSPDADSQEDAAFARLMQGRYITTARIMRNLAVDPSTVAEVSKRHSVVMLYWYARQCAQVLGVDLTSQRRALALASHMTEQARRVLVASFNVIADDEAGQGSVKLPASREANNSITVNTPHPLIVPSLLLTCSQICSSLSAQTNVLHQLVSHGFVVGVARLLDVAGDLVETLDGTSHAELSIAVSIAHRIAITFKNLTLYTSSATAMLQQGPLCVSVVQGLLACVLGVLAVSRIEDPRADGRVDLDTPLADAEGIIAVPLRRALVSIVSCAASSLAALSAIPAASNLLSEQGALDCSMKLCALACVGDDNAALRELVRTPTIEMSDQTQEVPLREFIVDCAVRCSFNLLANPNGIGMHQARKANIGAYNCADISSSEVVCDAPTPKFLIATFVNAIEKVAPVPAAASAACKRHAARMTCLMSMMTQLTADSYEDGNACRELHDGLLLSKIAELCKIAPEAAVREGAAVAFANVCSSNPSKYLPNPVINFVTEILAATQFTPTSNRPAVYAAVARSRIHKTGEKLDLLHELKRELLSLQHTAAAALLRCVSTLLKARPTIESKPNELFSMEPVSDDVRPAVITEEAKPDSWNAATSPLDNGSTPHSVQGTSQLPDSVGRSTPQIIAESARGADPSLRRTSSFGGPAADETASVKTPSQKTQVSQASLLALKSLIDREHEEMARRARQTESPHLRPFIECGIIPTIASIAINTRSLLRARMQQQLPAAPSTQKEKIKNDSSGSAGTQRASSAGRFRPQSARRASKAVDASKVPPSLVQDAVKWTNPSSADRQLSQFIAVMQYLCSDCLLAISRSPDAKGCLFGLDMQGPRPLTITSAPSMSTTLSGGAQVPDASYQRPNLVSMLGMRPAAGVDAMMALAKSGRIVLERLMAEAMAYLTQTHDHRVRFLQERAATVLATLARRSTMDAATQKWCTLGLKNLSEDVKLRSSVLEAGGVVQGVLMLLPDEAETPDDVKVLSPPPPGRATEEFNAAARKKTGPYENVGPGLELGDVFEIEGDTEDHDSVWSEEETDSFESAEETSNVSGSLRAAESSANSENGLQLKAYRVPRSWIPTESDKCYPSYPDLNQVRLLTGSGVLPDVDAVTDWTINDALMDAPHSYVHASEGEPAGSPVPRPTSLPPERSAASSMQDTQSKFRWNELLLHRTAAFADDLPKDSLAADLRQAMSPQTTGTRPEESKLPDSAFRHRVHFEKIHAYEKTLPRDVNSEDIPDYSCSIVTSELGLTDAVAKEIAASPAPEHACRSSEDLTKRSLALLKPFALPESELSALLLGHHSGDSQAEPQSTLTGDYGGYLVSTVAYAFLAEFPDRSMQTPQLSSLSAGGTDLPSPQHLQQSSADVKDAVIIRLSGRFDGTKLTDVDGDISKLATGRKRIHTLNDPWREPDDARATHQQGSIFNRLHSRMDSRDSLRQITTRQAQASRGVKLPEIPKSPEYAHTTVRSPLTSREQAAVRSFAKAPNVHESSSSSLPRLKPL
jgi:hypothetical protein